MSFDKNSADASGTMASVTVEEDGSFEVPDSGFTNAGAVFVGWGLTPGATTPDYSPYGSATYEELRAHGTSVTLYAIWDAVSYRVDYKPGEGTGSMPSSFHNPGEEAALSANTFTRFDYHFIGWQVQGSDTVYTNSIPANTYGSGQIVTLIAQYERDNHSSQLSEGELSFELKGGERAVFEELPAGTGYQLWEETETGWVLVGEVDSGGEIAPTETSEAWFHNQYQPGTVSAVIMAEKTLDGGTPAAGQFSFELVDSSSGQVLQTVTNSAAGTVNFAPLVYNGDETGSHSYTIREKTGTDTTVDYDAREHGVTVQVEDDGEGNLSAAVSYADGARPVFENNHKFGSLKITKDAGGNTTKEFSFVLSLTDKANQPYELTSVPAGLSAVDGTPGSYRFTLKGGESLEVGDLPGGTSYVVREVDLPGGWSASETSKSGVIAPTEESAAAFVNTYTVGGVSGVDVSFTAHKELEGKRLERGQFRFALEEWNESGNSWRTLQTKTNSDRDPYEMIPDENGVDQPNPWYGTGQVRFDELHYSGETSRRYRIRELIPAETDSDYDESVQYAENAYIVTVEVTDAGDGTLNAEVKYYRETDSEEVSGDALLFTNRVIPGELTVEKRVLNTSPVSAETAFWFTLRVNDVDGEPFVFAQVPAGLSAVSGTPGSYRFKLKGGESLRVTGLPYGCVYSLTEDAAAGFTQTQAVNASGEILTEDVTASFTNTYSASGSVEIPVRKTLVGGDIGEREFVVELSGEGLQTRTVSVPAAARDGSERAQSDFSITLNYSDVGDHGKEYRYRIREVANEAAAAFDGHSENVTVRVRDLGNGTLAAEYVFDGGGEVAEFVNTRLYELRVEKKVRGNLADPDKAFTIHVSVDGLPEGYEPELPEGWSEEESGEYRFELSHGESSAIRLPYGTSYSVREEAEEYRPSRVVHRENGSLSDLLEEIVGQAASDSVEGRTLLGNERVSFTNTLRSPVPTGVTVATGGGVLAGISLLGLALSRRRKQRRARGKH